MTKRIFLAAMVFFACEKLPEDCGNQFIDSDTQFCVNNQAFKRCWGKEFDPLTEFCHENVVYSKCNGKTYTPPNNPCIEVERSSSSVPSSSSVVPSSSSVAASSSSSAGQSSSSVVPPSSSSIAASSSSSAGQSSSSVVPPSSSSVSSSSAPSSSSSVASSSSVQSSSSLSSSSSSSSAVLACAMSATAGTVGTAITPAPTVTCNGASVASSLTWTPTSLVPSAAGSVAVSVTANSGACSGKTAVCGNVAVSEPVLECDMSATTGAVGTAITPAPAVTCNGASVAGNLTWTPANLTPTSPGNLAVSVRAGSGACNGKTAVCGDVSVSSTLACSMTATAGRIGVAISPTPTVTCNGTSVATSRTWTPASLIPAEAGNIAVSVSVGTGACNGMEASCGNVAVPEASCPNPSVFGNVLTCGGKDYRIEKIGEQTWMAENLNFDAPDSKCYSNQESNCGVYGRLYNWATAMNLLPGCNSSGCASQVKEKHQGVCPSGWHVPSQAEWDALSSHVQTASGCSSCDGHLLKATDGWRNNNGNAGGNGADEYGFSALPGGGGYSGGSFSTVGIAGNWWSASENDAAYAYIRYMYYGIKHAYWSNGVKDNLFSLRCLQD